MSGASAPKDASSRAFSRRELTRAAGFRLALGFALAMLGAMVLQFALVYVQMTSLEHSRSDALLRRETALLLAMPTEHMNYVISERSTDDLRLIINAEGVFTSSRERVVGDLRAWPEGLVEDGIPHDVTVQPEEGAPYVLRFIATRMPDGRILVLGRSRHMLGEQKLMLRRASLIAATPVLLFALMAGLWLSHRALSRVKEMHEAVDRIMQGDIHERLPAGRERDDLQRLAGSVNRMLDRLEQLMHDMREVGNDIAHDLRTPLARVRARLDRALTGANANSVEELHKAIGRAIDDLDQSFGIITALLRMAEIDNGRRRDGFAAVDLDDLAGDIIDLYEPIAESEGVVLQRDDMAPQRKGGVAEGGHVWAAARATEHRQNGVSQPLVVHGDRDLLIEVLANLVDNAIKFTKAGGEVRVSVGLWNDHPALSVTDTGPGVAPEEREAVLTRFYRSDKSRHVRGSGLGLSLVSSILRLHNAHVRIEDAQAGQPERGARFIAVFSAPAR
ncbi:HAMP domain-containing histidine kinase [Acetobacter sacchari]|uniref:histidine kinase n=1 Tax=Acetobacter sacchari TaxID=2661687 RepID=A0ABS3LVT6_9PROT|nr:HAMP domain-containing sensor histidine kinase [Acetobacter sacchari]MBO1360021.1 HAMP domain-containing histidine kinase [Acetobacter sacchari]